MRDTARTWGRRLLWLLPALLGLYFAAMLADFLTRSPGDYGLFSIRYY